MRLILAHLLPFGCYLTSVTHGWTLIRRSGFASKLLWLESIHAAGWRLYHPNRWSMDCELITGAVLIGRCVNTVFPGQAFPTQSRSTSDARTQAFMFQRTRSRISTRARSSSHCASIRPRFDRSGRFHETNRNPQTFTGQQCKTARNALR
jgi:hypothetical protein